MADDTDGPPVVPIPERVDRRLRLGPFPSARDALKFLCYAAVGAVAVPLVDVPGGLSVVGAGLLATLYKPDGQAWDERALSLLRWKYRSRREERMTGAGRQSPLLRQGLVRLAGADWVAVVRTGGAPLAYLPPAELARRFELYRDLLRGSDGRLAFLATLASIRAAPFLPPADRSLAADRDARAGYSELVALLCRRRYGRRVYFVLGGGEGGPDALARLEGQVASLLERLSGLGLRPVRLKDRGLLEAARRLGWAGPGADA